MSQIKRGELSADARENNISAGALSTPRRGCLRGSQQMPEICWMPLGI